MIARHLGHIVAFAVLWLAHARALKFADTSLREHRLYARLSALVLLLFGVTLERMVDK